MKKKIIALVWCSIVCIPCFLIFTGGGHPVLRFLGIHGGPSFENILALVYSAFLFKYYHLLIPDWMRSMVDNLVREDRMSSPD